MFILIWLLRGVLLVAGVPVLGLGLLALGVHYAPENTGVVDIHRSVLGSAPGARSAGSGAGLAGIVSHPSAHWAVPSVGALLVGLAFMGGGGRRSGGGKPEKAPGGGEPGPLRGRYRRRIERQARRMAKQGLTAQAAELCMNVGLLEAAAQHFEAAGDLVRAAELTHDQNRFTEAAVLFERGGRLDKAGEVFAAQGEHVRAGECFLAIQKPSVAAEEFEKGGDFSRAGDCYLEAGFDRHAAQAFLRCQAWEKAAESLERVIAEEGVRVGTSQSDREARELKKLVLQAGKLREQAGQLERALEVLDQGGCAGAAGDVAMRLEEFERAAELFKTARDAPKAAEALRKNGDAVEAARILGEHHRDLGDDAQAAALLEEAGDFSAAADLYRKLERHPEAGACFERSGEHAQAAEMYRVAGDLAKAADCYERAGELREAAGCISQLGDPGREAELLTAAGAHLAAGKLFREAGREGEAVKSLQQVDPQADDFAQACAVLGEIFSEKGMHSLAIKKLRQAVDGEPSRENLDVHYELATLCEARGNVREAAEVFERILALDYHYRDVAERLALVREQARLAPSSGSPDDTAPTAGPGRYQVIGELGRGGMGIVYQARDTVLDRVVAYKVLPDALRENPQALRNFLREAKSAAQLNHPNIVTVYDAGEQDGRYYIAMEYVDGTTLKAILRQRRRIPMAGVQHILVQMAQALAYAHEKKIIHRDIKTANTMWTKDRKAKIMDFGLAKVVEEVRNHTTLVAGTPYYMSPEQTLGKNLDHRTDIYSLGVTTFELATGVLPFREGNVPYHHVHTPPPDPQQLQPDLPPFLARIILRCLEKSPDARYGSASEILAELRAARDAQKPSPSA